MSRAADVRLRVERHTLDTAGPVYLLVWTTTPWTLPANQVSRPRHVARASGLTSTHSRHPEVAPRWLALSRRLGRAALSRADGARGVPSAVSG